MRGVATIGLLAFAAQAKVEDPMDRLVDKWIDRSLKVRDLLRMDLDGTTLGKGLRYLMTKMPSLVLGPPNLGHSSQKVQVEPFKLHQVSKNVLSRHMKLDGSSWLVQAAHRGQAVHARPPKREMSVQVAEEHAAKNVLVTGGSSGIGAATVRVLLARGHRVFATGRDLNAMNRLQQDLDNHGALKLSVGDVRNEKDVERQMKEAMSFFDDQLDAVVLNAGCTAKRSSFEDVPIEAFDRVMETNLRGTILWSQEALRIMKTQNSGQIVYTNSVGGIRAVPNAVVYAASKWAVQGLALSLRKEVAGSGVKIGLVNPGPVATEWWGREEHLVDGRENLPYWNSMLGPEDVANAILQLVDQPPSSNIEGVILDNSASGGFTPPVV